MSVTKTDSGKWNARYPVGDRKYKNRVFGKKKEADDFVAEMRKRLRTTGSFDPDAGKRTVENVAWEWYEFQPDTPNYRQNISSHLRNHLLPAIGNRPFATIGTRDLQRLVKQLEVDKVPTTVRTIMTTVSMVMRYAMREGILFEDPTLDLKLPKVVETELRPLEISHVHLLANHIFPRYKAVVLFAAATGCRQGEVFAVRTWDVEFIRGEGSVKVYDQVQSYTGNPQSLTGKTKTRKSRTIPVSDDVLDFLEEHMKEYPPVDGFVFTNTEGRPLHRRVFDRAFDAARRRATAQLRSQADELYGDDAVRLSLEMQKAQHVLDCVFHSLRHFYASLLIRMGLSPKTVAARLGHSNPMVTLKRYAHLWPDDEDRTRDAVHELFKLSEGQVSM